MLARAAAHEGPTRPPQVALLTQEIVDVMSRDKKVLDFPKAEITSEEKARRSLRSVSSGLLLYAVSSTSSYSGTGPIDP